MRKDRGALDLSEAERSDTFQQLPKKEGILKKLGTNNRYKKRYFCLTNWFLNYYDSKKKTKILGSCNLCELIEDPSLSGRFGDFVLRSSWEEIQLTAADIKEASEWVSCITARRAYFHSHPPAKLLPAASSENGSKIELQAEVKESEIGELDSVTNGKFKKSLGRKSRSSYSSVSSTFTRRHGEPNMVKEKLNFVKSLSDDKKREWETNCIVNMVKRGSLKIRPRGLMRTWHKREFRICNGGIYWYQNERMRFADFLGGLDVASITWEAYNESEQVYSLNGPGVKYLIKAESMEELKSWILALEKVKETNENKGDQPQQANEEPGLTTSSSAPASTEIPTVPHSTTEQSLLARSTVPEVQPKVAEVELPPWILAFDDSSSFERKAQVNSDLEKRFAPPIDAEDVHDAADALMLNLDHVVEVSLGLVNELQEIKLKCLDEAHFRPDILIFYIQEYNDRLELELKQYMTKDVVKRMATQEMVSISRAIVVFESFLHELRTEDVECRYVSKLPTFSLSETLESLGELFVKELQDKLGSWMENIIRDLFSKGGDGIKHVGHGKTELGSRSPVDIFNMINESLIMSKGSNIPQFHIAALSCCLVAIADYSISLIIELNNNRSGVSLMKDLDFLVAMTNDCSTISKYIELLKNGEFGELDSETKLDWSAATTKCKQASSKLCSFIVDLIDTDLKLLFDLLFTPDHLYISSSDDMRKNVVARIAATLHDYFTDVSEILYEEFLHPLMRMVVRGFTNQYCRKLLEKNTSLFTNPREYVDQILSESGTGIETDQLLPLTGSLELDIDDIFHIRADRDLILNMLKSFVSNADTRFESETLLLSTMVDFLSVSPQFFTNAVEKTCLQFSEPTVHRAIIATALGCLGMRSDISVDDANDIRKNMAASLRKTLNASLFTSTALSSSASTSTIERGSIFTQVWPDLTLNTGMKGQLKNLALLSRKKSASRLAASKATSKSRRRSSVAASVAAAAAGISIPTPSPDGEDILSANAFKDSEEGSGSTKFQRSVKMLKAVQSVVTEEAALKRKQMRLDKIDVSDETRDVQMYGYLDFCVERTSSDLWQRRWLMLHQALEQPGCQWKLFLTWYLDRDSSERLHRLALENVRGARLTTKLPVSIASDGFSIELSEDSIASSVTKATVFEFEILASESSPQLRSRSLNETLQWINAINKAVRDAKAMSMKQPVLTTPREVSLGELKASESVTSEASVDCEDFSKMNLSELRSVCKSKHMSYTTSSTRAELISLLRASKGQRKDMKAAATIAANEEKNKLLWTKPVVELRKKVEESGLESDKLMSKKDLVDLMVGEGISSASDEEAYLRQMVARGLNMLDYGPDFVNDVDERDAVTESIEGAVAIFEKAAREANQLGFSMIEARALYGLAKAYSHSESRKAAAPVMLDMATRLFLNANEISDAHTCASEASEVYVNLGDYEQAIQTLVDFDTMTNSFRFEEQIEALRKESEKSNEDTLMTKLANKMRFFPQSGSTEES